ncbi:dTDP-glucose 4,6-dehydratase [filamentous cyanobacterium CCP5]|nr:dTDP-glucose 4,6-dehydratase [filamentous cyanobacterium CCP5]
MAKTVLITGVAGFIGRYVARYFTTQGWVVVGVDNAPPENAPSATLTAYYPMQLPSSHLVELLQIHVPDLCIHCAGRASVGLSMSSPGADFYVGPVLTFEMLNALRLYAPQCRFIFLSSAAVYGNPVSLPVSEAQVSAPLSPYGFHKLQCEQLCLEFAKIYHLPTASVRIFSAYGPGLRRQVIWDICRKALMEKQLMLQGSGQESRDFVHALDIARAIDAVVNRAPMQGEVYNLASGREVKIAELANLVVNALDYNLTPEFDGVIPPGNPLNWQADISQLQALGFSASVSLEQGLKTFVSWCRSELAGV